MISKALCVMALAASFSLSAQVERRPLGYSINGVEVVRRHGPSEFSLPSGVSSVSLYSDSAGQCRQAMFLLIRLSGEAAVGAVEFAYEDGSREAVRTIRDRSSIYCLVDRCAWAYSKRLCSVSVAGIEILAGPEALRGFARELGME